jgi:hypothetical protein
MILPFYREIITCQECQPFCELLISAFYNRRDHLEAFLCPDRISRMGRYND